MEFAVSTEIVKVNPEIPNPFEIVIRKKTLGELITNAAEAKKETEALLEAKYNISAYTGDIDAVRRDKAEINNAIELINSRRIQLEKEWNEPFLAFKNTSNEIIDILRKASEKLKGIEDEHKGKERARKLADIESYWNSKGYTLVSLDKIFSQKWLNKTMKIKDVQNEIDARIEQIDRDLHAIEDFGSDVDTLKPLYLSSLNLQTTLSKGAELKANREKLAAMETGKNKVQEELREEKTSPVVNVDSGTKEVKSEVVEKKQEVKIVSNKLLYEFEVVTDEAFLGNIAEMFRENKIKSKIALKAIGTQSQLLAFKAELEESGITYNKVIKDKVLTLEIV